MNLTTDDFNLLATRHANSYEAAQLRDRLMAEGFISVRSARRSKKPPHSRSPIEDVEDAPAAAADVAARKTVADDQATSPLAHATQRTKLDAANAIPSHGARASARLAASIT